MSKFFKAAAVLLCFAFVLIAVPTLNSAVQKPMRPSLALFLNQPVQTLTAAMPFLNIFYGKDMKATKVFTGKMIVRPTTDVSIGRPGSGD
jgi:hypothetical protein